MFVAVGTGASVAPGMDVSGTVVSAMPVAVDSGASVAVGNGVSDDFFRRVRRDRTGASARDSGVRVGGSGVSVAVSEGVSVAVVGAV